LPPVTFRPARFFVATVALMVAAIAGPVAGSSAAPPIWEPNFGAEVPIISVGDDSATEIEIGTFAFPFYGVTHTGAEKFGVSSNGLIQFGPGNTDNTPTGEEARTGSPKIAALWADLNPAIIEAVDRGAVYSNTFNEDGDPAVDRVVFTWDSAFFGCEKSPSCRALVQVQLFESGRIVFGYNGVLTNQAFDNYGGGGEGLMPVLAQGGFVKPPGFVPLPPGLDYSEAVPFTGGGLIFESFESTPVRFDLDQNNLVFDPSGAGYQVSSTVPFSRLPGAGAAASTEDKKAPKAGLKKAGKQDLDKVLASGLKLQLNCNEACFAEISASVKSPKVKKAGSGVGELSKSGKGKVVVTLNKAAKTALAKVSKATFKLTAVVFDEAGNKKKVKATVTAK
jgi:hypothetical protein